MHFMIWILGKGPFVKEMVDDVGHLRAEDLILFVQGLMERLIELGQRLFLVMYEG